jgi:hypothetical protein
MSVRSILIRGLALAGAAALCAAIAVKLGPWKAIALWAGGVAIVDGAVALLMHRQSPPEKISWINYLAGVVLPWGYRIGRGKLWPIVATSWAIWMLVGITAITAAAAARSRAESNVTGPTAAVINVLPHHDTLVLTFLCVAWLIDGGVLLRCVGLLATSANASHVLRSLAVPMLMLSGILIASVALVLSSNTPAAARTALLIAGGPPLFVGVGYGAFVLVLLTAGKNARWN